MSSSSPIRSYFGDQVVNQGFVVLPNLLLRNYRQLGISEETLVFTLHLISIVWNYADPPKSLPEIAERMGKSVSMVRRYSHALNEAGLVVIRPRWKQGQQIGNDYDLSPLWSRLASLATAGPERSDDGIVLGRPIEADAGDADMHGGADLLMDRAEMHAPAPAEMAGLGHADLEGVGRADLEGVAPAEMTGLNGREEDQESQEQQDAAAAATATFAQIVSLVDARKLVARYPGCIPHAAAIVEEVSNAHVENKGGLLVRLVERGWTAPATTPSQRMAAARPPDADAAMLAKFSRCPYCRGPIGDCDCTPAWLRGATDSS